MEEDDNAEDEKRRVAAETAMLPMHNTIQMVSSVDCWLLWIGVAALAGGGQLVSANVNQMCESLGASLLRWRRFIFLQWHPPSILHCLDTGYGRATVAVSLFAVGNGLGRILAGSLSEVIHQSRLAPRPLNLFFATAIMGLAHLLFWLELGVAGLYLGVFLAAFAFGAVSFCLLLLPALCRCCACHSINMPVRSAHVLAVWLKCRQTWPLTVVVTSELWGTKHHGANYLFFGMASH